MRCSNCACSTWGHVVARVAVGSAVGLSNVVDPEGCRDGTKIEDGKTSGQGTWVLYAYGGGCTYIPVCLVFWHIVSYSQPSPSIKPLRLSAGWQMVRRSRRIFRSLERAKRLEELTANKLHLVAGQHISRNSIRRSPLIHEKRRIVQSSRFKRH